MIPLYEKGPARWIWTEEVTANRFVLATRVVNLDAVPESALLAVFADTKYKVYVNGRFVNAGPAPFRKPVVWVDRLDLRPYLGAGENTLAILAWFGGVTTKYNTVEQPGILAELRLRAGEEEPQIVGTEGDWRVAALDCWAGDTPRRNWALEPIEDLDSAHPAYALLAEAAGEDYGPAGEADGAALWQVPRVFARDDLELRQRMVPLLRWEREDLFRPRQIFRGNTEIHNWRDTADRLGHEHVWPELDERVYEMQREGHVVFDRREGEPGFLLLYDFGRVCAGDPAVEIFCEAPCTLDLALAEGLGADGRPDIARGGSLYYSRYHLRAGVNRVRFYHFNSYRFLYLVCKDAVGRVEVRRVSGHHCRSDLEFDDTFSSNCRAAESLYRISRRSLILNTQAYTYDCNSREQGTYWGDSIWITESVGHLTGEFSHMRHLCYAASDEVASLGPFIHASLYGLGGVLFDYCLVPCECLARYYRFTADAEAVTDNLPALRTIVEAFRELRSDNGLLALRHVGEIHDDFGRGKGLLFLDHPGNGWHAMTTTGIDRRDDNAGLNLYYLQAVQALAQLEAVAGNDPGELEDEAGRLRDAIRVHFLDEDHGLLADAAGPEIERPRFSQIVNALAITTGVLRGAEAGRVLATVLDVSRHPWVSQGTPYSCFFLAEAAAVTRRGDATMRAFTHEFAEMLRRGATTTWEAWRAENHDSLNHAWSAPLPHLLRRAVMGLSARSPGYEKLELAPDFSCFQFFETTCHIPAGKVHMHWAPARAGTVDLQVQVPEGVEATLHLPGGKESVCGTWTGQVPKEQKMAGTATPPIKKPTNR